jgi:hypothetical protein
MSYEITIKKIDTKQVTKRGEHTIIDTRPWTEEEISDARRYDYGQSGREAWLKANPTKNVYGYAPDYSGSETKETEVLKQSVDDLDLAAVIKAINNL